MFFQPRSRARLNFLSLSFVNCLVYIRFCTYCDDLDFPTTQLLINRLGNWRVWLPSLEVSSDSVAYVSDIDLELNGPELEVDLRSKWDVDLGLKGIQVEVAQSDFISGLCNAWPRAKSIVWS
ncbi:hypothetical protein PGT21_027187 [Puccinia graminis f. sp. tritici]|uniref:Uncharacterized protein n=1 Tax=Puccinia graminis f. sp. tritici TaxID=56615 RepID=A0A5B0MU08_PUCGR|nr:hypothetical protein PGT21_027187 [Puccinia graminis f. sp. tritici]